VSRGQLPTGLQFGLEFAFTKEDRGRKTYQRSTQVLYQMEAV